jgi:hypothetical protein
MRIIAVFRVYVRVITLYRNIRVRDMYKNNRYKIKMNKCPDRLINRYIQTISVRS